MFDCARVPRTRINTQFSMFAILLTFGEGVASMDRVSSRSDFSIHCLPLPEWPLARARSHTIEEGHLQHIILVMLATVNGLWK